MNFECQDCPLAQTRINIVYARSNCNLKNVDILFIGEAPGKMEDIQGVPFVGPSGKLLNKKLEQLEVNWAIMNVLKCRPPNNKYDLSYTKQCRKYLIDDIERLSPKLLVAIGGSAFTELTGQVGITSSSGKILHSSEKYGNKDVLALIHPAAVLYDRHKNLKYWEKGWNILYEMFITLSPEEYW